MKLVLASTSRYRRELLARLQLPFESAAPDVDETALRGETPPQTALRLAQLKARAVAQKFPAALIIGSDQVATLDGAQIGKPGGHARALAQLKSMQGRAVIFHTALCLLNSASGRMQVREIPVTVHFRQLSDAQIEAYLRKEQPYDCAGSAKSEGLGIALVERYEGDDPNALIGLPLIALTDMLRGEGLDPLLA